MFVLVHIGGDDGKILKESPAVFGDQLKTDHPNIIVVNEEKVIYSRPS